MHHRSHILLLVLLLGLQAPLRAAEAPGASEGLSLDLVSLRKAAGSPPAPDSLTEKEDKAILKWLQEHRTPEWTSSAWLLLDRSPTLFAKALGIDMGKTTPTLIKALSSFLGLVDQATIAVKNDVRRPRPYTADASVQPCLPREEGFSFPSGHAAWYRAASLLLADLIPIRRERLLEVGMQGGVNRTICGVHYASDVVAGQKLGQAAAAQIIASPQWQQFRSDPSLQKEIQRIQAVPDALLPFLIR